MGPLTYYVSAREWSNLELTKLHFGKNKFISKSGRFAFIVNDIENVNIFISIQMYINDVFSYAATSLPSIYSLHRKDRRKRQDPCIPLLLAFSALLPALSSLHLLSDTCTCASQDLELSCWSFHTGCSQVRSL